jgi:hypothetical protein
MNQNDMTMLQTVFVVMGEGDNGGTLPESTLRVFASRKHADKYAKELYDDFFPNVSIMERKVEISLKKYSPI